MDTTQTVKLADDSFIHFTLQNRAEEIIAGRKLLANPPYDKFGIEGVQAISVNHGTFVPGVQLSHINGDKPVVGILFKTNTMPKYGYPEEVIWSRDVNLIDPKIISVDSAISMLKDSNDGEFDDVRTVYETLLSSMITSDD